MKTYKEIVQEYRKRQRDTMVDAIATGLTYMDEIAVDTGMLEETGPPSAQAAPRRRSGCSNQVISFVRDHSHSQPSASMPEQMMSSSGASGWRML